MKVSNLKTVAIAACCALPVLLLSGCADNSPKPDQQIINPAPLTLKQRIHLRGVQFIQQGSRLQLILPTDKFFRLQSTEIKAHQIETLKMIARYLKGYLGSYHVKPLVTVSGYTDTVFKKQQRYKRSNQYAQVVASYLWNQGFSHQQLRVQGFGSTHPIANPKTTQGSGFNRRVVIQVN